MVFDASIFETDDNEDSDFCPDLDKKYLHIHTCNVHSHGHLCWKTYNPDFQIVQLMSTFSSFLRFLECGHLMLLFLCFPV